MIQQNTFLLDRPPSETRNSVRLFFDAIAIVNLSRTHWNPSVGIGFVRLERLVPTAGSSDVLINVSFAILLVARVCLQ